MIEFHRNRIEASHERNDRIIEFYSTNSNSIESAMFIIAEHELHTSCAVK